MKEAQFLVDLRFLPGKGKNIDLIGTILGRLDELKIPFQVGWIFTGLSLLELKGDLEENGYESYFNKIANSYTYLAGYSGGDLAFMSQQERQLEISKGREVFEQLDLGAPKGYLLYSHKKLSVQETPQDLPTFFIQNNALQGHPGSVCLQKKCYYWCDLSLENYEDILHYQRKWGKKTLFYILNSRTKPKWAKETSFPLEDYLSINPVSNRGSEEWAFPTSPRHKAPYIQPYDPRINNLGEAKLISIHRGLKKAHYPKSSGGVLPEGMMGGIPERDLEFNMQGHTQLQLNTEFVHFREGRLQEVSFPPTSYRSLGPVRSYIKTEQGLLPFETRSSFSLSGPNYWGMREILELESTLYGKGRLVVEYLSFEEFPHLCVSYTVSYPPRLTGKVETLAPFELPLMPISRLNPAVVQTGDPLQVEGKIKILPHKHPVLWGNSYNFNCGANHVSLVYPEMGGQSIHPLPVSVRKINGKKFMTILPGGSQIPLRGEDVAGFEEHQNFVIFWERYLHPDNYVLPDRVKEAFIPSYIRGNSY